jgi:hypothetical protein
VGQDRRRYGTICAAYIQPENLKRPSRKNVFMSDFNDLFAALERSIADMVERTQLDTKIHARVRALMQEHGLEYGYSEDEALEQAILEATRGLEK